jgi:four helix bundle protein
MSERDIEKRTFEFALRIIRLCRALDDDRTGRVLVNQLLRSGTSIGANVEEAQGAQSKPDFIAKMSIAQKEARETLYWLRLIAQSELQPAEKMVPIIQEADEILRIVSAIIVSAVNAVTRGFPCCGGWNCFSNCTHRAACLAISRKTSPGQFTKPIPDISRLPSSDDSYQNSVGGEARIPFLEVPAGSSPESPPDTVPSPDAGTAAPG